MSGAFTVGMLVKDKLLGQVWAITGISPDGSLTLQRSGVSRAATILDVELLAALRTSPASPQPSQSHKRNIH